MFNKIFDRRANGSVKWSKFDDHNIIPLWVADMDFKSPQPIIDAVKKVADYGVLGYTLPKDSWYDTIQNMLLNKYDWKVDKEWIIPLPSLIPAINSFATVFSNPSDQILINTPNYNNFFECIKYSNRRPLAVPLIYDKNYWSTDCEAMRAAITPTTKSVILCNPHNPVGRVYTRDELIAMAQVCIDNNLIICSDEIHCDLIFDNDRQHIPLATISQEIANRTLTFMSPGKTYNLGGLNCGFAIIPNPELRIPFAQNISARGPFVNIFAFAALEAAYSQCDDWYAEMKAYLGANRDLVFNSISQMPDISTTHVEGTFLHWLDAQNVCAGNPTDFFEAAGVGLSDGTLFGAPGFLRLNYATPRSILKEALERMGNALACV